MNRARRAPRLGRALAAVATTLVAVAVAVALPAAASPGGRQTSTAALALADQTTLVPVGGRFALAVRTDGVPGTASLRLEVHDRARSRTELARALAGDAGRAVLRTVTLPLSGLPIEADGSRRATIALDDGPGRAVTTPGVYPVEVTALDATGAPLDSLVTDLVLLPDAAEATPPLAVSVVAELRGGSDAPDLDRQRALFEVVAEVEGVPTTLALWPDHLADLALGSSAAQLAVLDAVRGAVGGNPVLDLPYTPTSPDALAEAGLADELRHQRNTGRAVLQALFDVQPTEQTWLAGPGLGAAGLRLLSALGIRHALVEPERVERVTDGVLSPARPFVLAPPKDGTRRPTGPAEPIDGLLLDAVIATAVHGPAEQLDDGTTADPDEPALVAARVLGDLAQLWFEQPGTARAAVVPVDPSVDPVTVRRLLEGLRASALFRPVPLDEAFSAAPLVDGSGNPVRRSLVPADERAFGDEVARGVQAIRSVRSSVQQMVGDASPILARLDRRLLAATAEGLNPAERRRELAEARSTVDGVGDAISSPERFTITLTARQGTVPLTIRNDTGAPVDVRLRFTSSKLELPDGDERELRLEGETTRIEVAVRTRASGSFPFEVEITSPDGALPLTTTIYNVRSTAVSGVGLALSIGAGLFLVIWWARHWRSSRATKLVDGGSEA